LQAIVQALFHVDEAALLHAGMRSCWPAVLHSRQKYFVLSCMTACLLVWCLASMPSCLKASMKAAHRANRQSRQQDKIAIAATPIVPATNETNLPPCNHFHRENLPKHCLGEKCDKHYCMRP
jgi:hypothetical protein